MSTADIIIIGGGIMGTSIARALARAGAGRVRVLERRFLGAGSSGKSGAILRQHYSHEVTVRMAGFGLDVYGSFTQETGHDIGFRRPGMIFITRTTDREVLERNVALQLRCGVETGIVDAAGLATLEPRGVYGDVLAAHEPRAAYVDPMKAVAGFAADARAMGATVEEGVGVHSIEVKGDRVTGVTTDEGEVIDAGVVINAGGPWARRLTAALGRDDPLTVVRPQQAFFEPSARFGPPTAIVGDLDGGAYWKSEPKGFIRVGDMSYEDDEVVDPDDYDEGVSNEFIEACRSRVKHRLPRFAEAVSWGGCGALYTVTPDAHPLIGEIPGIAGLYLVAGFSGHGFKMGPAVGKGVAALITGGDRGPFDPEFFAVDRFEKGRPVTTAYQYGLLG